MMPEKIWAAIIPGISDIGATVGSPMWGHKAVWVDETEYIRADLVSQLQKQRDALCEALKSVLDWYHGDGSVGGAVAVMDHAEAAMLESRGQA